MTFGPESVPSPLLERWMFPRHALLAPQDRLATMPFSPQETNGIEGIG